MVVEFSEVVKNLIHFFFFFSGPLQGETRFSGFLDFFQRPIYIHSYLSYIHIVVNDKIDSYMLINIAVLALSRLAYMSNVK